MTDPTVNDNGDPARVVFGRNKSVTLGDPVRVTKHQGLWRLVGLWFTWDATRAEAADGTITIDFERAWFAEVVGPYFPKDPAKNKELSRVFAVTALKWADKATKADVTMQRKK